MNRNLTLTAHRGWPVKFPENTLLSFSEALKAGAKAVEFDVQISADGVPMVFHDPTLKRASGEKGVLAEMSAAELALKSIHYPSTFGKKFIGLRMPTLEETVDELNKNPGVAAFVEAKRHSIEKFGAQLVLEEIMNRLAKAEFNWTLISFNSEILTLARKRFSAPIGLIIRGYDAKSKLELEKTCPEYVFIDAKKIPPLAASLWEGNWSWAAYDVEDEAEARRLAEKGARIIECDDVGKFINFSLFSPPLNNE